MPKIISYQCPSCGAIVEAQEGIYIDCEACRSDRECVFNNVEIVVCSVSYRMQPTEDSNAEID